MCCLYVNGRAAQQYTYTRAGNFPSDMPTQFMLLNVNNLSKEKGTAFDELRISDVVRYTEDFTPPSRGTHFQLDQHTGKASRRTLDSIGSRRQAPRLERAECMKEHGSKAVTQLHGRSDGRAPVE
jgi:hypothetical protein